jgi:hypothetical protein
MKAGGYDVEIRLLQYGEPVERLLIAHELNRHQATALIQALLQALWTVQHPDQS